MTHLTPTEHRTILVVDVVGSPTLADLPDMMAVREGMYDV